MTGVAEPARGEPEVRPEVVQAVVSALTDLAPGKLKELTGVTATATEYRQAVSLYAKGAETAEPAPPVPPPKSVWLKTRPIWSIATLIIVGVYSFLHYPHSGLINFYVTAASVIATLYVAIAFGVFAAKDSAGGEMTFEHWVFMVASSAGLLASLRGLSAGPVHDVWQTNLLTGLTVVGLTAAVLLVGERLIAWRLLGTKPAVPWTLLFVAAAVALAIFP